jgi:hypothetical protein
LVNEEQDFSVFLHPSSIPVAQETPPKWLKSSMNWNLLPIWWGLFYISETVVLVVLPFTSGCNFSVPSALQLSRTVTLCFDFVPSWQETPLYVSVLLDRRL